MNAPLDVLDHCAQAVGRPDLVALEPDVYALRFETMKVLSARGALQRLLDDGTLRRGDTVIDSSSGIYALALGLACHELGLRCRVIGSTTIDPAMRAQLELLGVELEQMPPTSSLRLDQDRRVRRVREVLAAEPHVHWMRQYHDPVHDEGYLPVGEGLAAALRDRGHEAVDLVAAVGSGVSGFAVAQGISRVLPVQLTGVQPFGSVTFGAEHVDDPDIIIAGIGSSIPFGNVRHEAYSTVHWLSHEVACCATTELMRRHALFAGLSTGAAWAAALHERQSRAAEGRSRATVLIAPDTGHRYADAVHCQHHEHGTLTQYKPLDIESTHQLRHPWCRMAWDGRPAPPSARHSGPPDTHVLSG